MSRKRRTNNDNKVDDSWLLPYADMLTLLLALFIVLFAMSEVDVKRFKQLAYIFETEFVGGAGIIDDGMTLVPEDHPEAEGVDENSEDESDITTELEDELVQQEFEELKTMQKNIDEYITTNNLTDILGTQLTGEGLFVTVRTDVTFDTGSAQVRDEAKEIAKEIASFLNTDPPHAIVVSGHADDRPMYNEEFASNWELSSMRAIQFMYLLLEDANIEPKWFSAKGYGEYQPLVPNTSEENRAINRRVEVLIEPNYDITDEVNKNE